MKAKPNPDTQARLDAHDGMRHAAQKAASAELTLATFHAQCVAAGVTSFNTLLSREGWLITISNGKTSAHMVAPPGAPFVLYAVAALEAFKKGWGRDTTPRLPPDVPGPLVPTPADMPRAEEIKEEWRKNWPAVDKTVDKAAQAADLAKRAAAHPNSITRPPAAGAGERKPLGLPLCVQCKAQPVYTVGAQHCGGSCAKQWYMNRASRA